MDKRYAEVKSPGELLSKLAELAAPFGEVEKVRLLCPSQQHESVLCLVEAKSGAQAVAEAIGGFMFGNTPAVHFGPVPADFRCARRETGGARDVFCDCQRFLTPK